MTETLTANPEMTTMRTEPFEVAIQRVRMETPIVPQTDENAMEEGVLNAYVIASRQENGNYQWSTRFWRPVDEGVWADPQSNPEDEPVFQMASDHLRSDDFAMTNITRTSERWWEGTNMAEPVNERLREAFTVSSGEKNLDILNCSTLELTEQEQKSLQTTLQHLASFTGNKIFDRVSGVILAEEGDFEEGTGGAYNFGDRIIRINMGFIRGQEGKLHPRYKKYFSEDSGITNMEVFIAHEFGHSMDINTLSEADAHFIDKSTYQWTGMGDRSNSFSAFDDKFGWEHTVERPVGQAWGGQTHHMIDPAQEVESRENSPTTYGTSSPKEDFAESFAIAALGGDVAAFPARYKVIAESLPRAEGEVLVGPQMVTMKKYEPAADGVYRPDARVKALALRVLVK
jgi:hypothetical protein